MKNALLLFSLLFCAANGFSQANNFTALTGKVIDPQGQPLAGVTIYLKSKTAGTTSGADGSFQLKVPENEVVMFRYIGYEPVGYNLPEIELEFNNLITLETSANNLPECVISAFKVPLVNCDGLSSCSVTSISGCFRSIQYSNTVTESTSFYNVTEPYHWQYAPNPTKDAVVVQTPQAAGDILIFSVAGNTISKVKVTDTFTRIELNSYPAGMYFMYFQNGNLLDNIGKVVLIKD